ncbi:PEP-CTERM sorting domain-containing protein [bacterium]|nr:PEP-CTERM sorting domain-containing protein [bacterium]
MRIVMTLLLLAIGLFSNASAYVVSFTNVPEANNTAVPIFDNAQQPIAVGAGYAAVGTFEVVPTSVEEIRSSFSVFGDGPTSFENDLLGVNKAFFELSRSAPIPQGAVGGPVGQNIYVVVGGGRSLACSTGFAVFDSGLVFGTDGADEEGRVSVNISSGTLTPESLVFGELEENVDIFLGLRFSEGIATEWVKPPGWGAGGFDGVWDIIRQSPNELAPELCIPEPSTSLLLALAGLAVAARRSRQVL